MPVDGQAPPLEVSVPIRFSPDGRSWSDGIVTTLTSSTLVVLSSAAPEIRSKVYFALGIGFESPTFHGEGRVTGLASTEPAVEPMPGFGLRFEGAPSDLAAAIAKLEHGYPGALALETDCGVAWPVQSDAVTPARGADEGLVVWAGGKAVMSVGAAEAPGALARNGNEPLPAYVALLVRLAGPLASCHTASVVISHRGRPLSPAHGIPTRPLVASLTALGEAAAAASSTARTRGGVTPAPEGDWSLDVSDFDAPTMEIKNPQAVRVDDPDDPPSVAEVLWDHPLVELVATQMRMVDTLALADWRYQRLTSDLLASLDRDRTLLDGIQLRITTAAEEAGLSEDATAEITRTVEDLATFVTRLAWHAIAIESAAASASFYETFQIEKERLARQAAISARAAARDAAEDSDAAQAEPAHKEREEAHRGEGKPKKEARRKEEKSKKAKPSRSARDPLVMGEWTKVPIWVIVVAVISVLVAITRISNATRGRRPPPPTAGQLDVASLRTDLMKVASTFQIRDAVVEGKTLELVVDTLWLGRSPKERQADLEAICLPVIGRNFADFLVVSPDGKHLASFHKGSFEVVGFTKPTPNSDAGH